MLHILLPRPSTWVMAMSNNLNFLLVVNHELLMLSIFYSQNLLFYYSRCYLELKVVCVCGVCVSVLYMRVFALMCVYPCVRTFM